MIPDYLIHTAALIGALNFAGIVVVVAWYVWATVAAYREARRRRRDLEALSMHVRERYERDMENRIQNEWQLREAAEIHTGVLL